MANGINNVVLQGYVAKDATFHSDPNAAKPYSLAKFSLGISESFKVNNNEWQSKSQWFQITCWNKLAEYARDKVKAGKEVTVEGHLQADEFVDKNTGEKRFGLTIVADSIKAALPDYSRNNGQNNNNNDRNGNYGRNNGYNNQNSGNYQQNNNNYNRNNQNMNRNNYQYGNNNQQNNNYQRNNGNYQQNNGNYNNGNNPNYGGF